MKTAIKFCHAQTPAVADGSGVELKIVTKLLEVDL